MNNLIKHINLLLIIVSCCVLSTCTQKSAHYSIFEVTEPIPQQALCFSKQQLNKPYILGGQGPDSFDCSGIIICAYEDALQTPLLLMNKRNEIRDDVNMDELYLYNVRFIGKDELLPGDIVFITIDSTRISHGGLFIGWKDDKTIEFINASSYYKKVCIDEWPIEGTKRGQWFVGFGRLNLRIKDK